jgi:hypothetical protein
LCYYHDQNQELPHLRRCRDLLKSMEQLRNFRRLVTKLNTIESRIPSDSGISGNCGIFRICRPEEQLERIIARAISGAFGVRTFRTAIPSALKDFGHICIHNQSTYRIHISGIYDCVRMKSDWRGIIKD